MPIIAGGANNQLAKAEHGEELRRRGILYAPDFVINAGGIIEICRQLQNASVADCKQNIAAIGCTLIEIFRRSDAEKYATNIVAERVAEQRFMHQRKPVVSSAA